MNEPVTEAELARVATPKADAFFREISQEERRTASGAGYAISSKLAHVFVREVASLERELAAARAAIKVAREIINSATHVLALARPIVSRAMVASCNCMTKTPVETFHADHCRYKQAAETMTALESVMNRAALAQLNTHTHE